VNRFYKDLGRREFLIVSKGIIEKIPRKKGLISLGIIIIVLLGAFFVVNMVKGDKTVDFITLADTEIPQEITTQVIPDYRSLERALACKVDDKVFVMVSRGEKPTSGFDLDIDRMVIEDKNGSTNLIVYVIFRDPEPGVALSQVLTYPLKIAETSLTELPGQIELRVQY
jgi:hypothetical protein